jgi:hypothetical protein
VDANYRGDLSKLVHLGAVQKSVSDARTATYVILSLSSGPGGRWFKSTRPDHFQIFACHWFTPSFLLRLRRSFVDRLWTNFGRARPGRARKR